VALRGSTRGTGAVARLAEAASLDAATEVKPMSAAGVYPTYVDVMTGELDVSGLPDEMGVYAVYDEDSRLMYIGLSRQISKSIAGHADAIGIQDVGSVIRDVRCLEMPGQSKETLKATWERWIKDHMESGGEIPAGNLPEGAPGADPRWRSRAGKARPSLNLAGARGIHSPAEALDAVKRAVEENPVVLFMKGTPAMPQCGFSGRSVGILGEIGATYESVNVMDEISNPGVRDAVKQFKGWPTIPQLYVNGELVGGADIISELYASGQLKEQITSAAAGGASSADGAGSGAPAVAAERGEIQLVDNPQRPTASLMSRMLNEGFDLYGLRIKDESAQHEGDAGALEMGLTSESHFRVEMVAPEFEGLSPVARQQKVFGVLSDVMPKIHALSLVTRTPSETA